MWNRGRNGLLPRPRQPQDMPRFQSSVRCSPHSSRPRPHTPRSELGHHRSPRGTSRATLRSQDAVRAFTFRRPRSLGHFARSSRPNPSRVPPSPGRGCTGRSSNVCNSAGSPTMVASTPPFDRRSIAVREPSPGRNGSTSWPSGEVPTCGQSVPYPEGSGPGLPRRA